MNDTLELEETTITFEIVPATAGIAPDQKLSLERSFLPFFQELETLKAAAAAVTNATEARAVRLALVKVRTGGDKVRKEMKEASLREGRAIDGANAILLHGLSPIEKAMELIETEEARKELARIDTLVAERKEKLRAVGVMAPPSNLSVLDEHQFECVLKDAAELQRIKAEREAKAEEDRLAKIEADRLERIRIEEENARLKAEAEETARLAKIEADRLAAERAEEQRKLKVEADERERKAKIESDRIAKERAEEARKAKEALEAQEAAARKERAKLEAEAKAEADRIAKVRAEEQRQAQEAMAKANAEAAKARQEAQAAADKAKAIQAEADRKAKALADEQDRVRKAEAAAKAKAAKAPDKEKLVAWLEAFKAMPLPTMATTDGEHALSIIKVSLNKAFGEVKATIDTL